MDELLKFAPEDDHLLHIPLFTSAIDPFALCFMDANREYNHGISLLGFMQSINSVLAKIFAAHKYIRTEETLEGRPQSQIDKMVYLGHLAISEYHTSIIVFFLKLRLLVDELLRIIQENKCNSIGEFLGKYEEHFNDVKPFLVALNASANHIKHNEEFLLSHTSDIPCFYPSLKIKIKKAKSGPRKFDFDNLKNNCPDKIVYINEDESEIIWEFSLLFFIENFNKFKQLYERRMKN